jgi:hypothetical protein
MLREVLQAVESAEGPITLNELSHRLNLDPRVLDGMLEHWSRRGKLIVDNGAALACAGGLMGPGRCTCGSAATKEGCPFVARLPKSYSVSVPVELLVDNGKK